MNRVERVSTCMQPSASQVGHKRLTSSSVDQTRQRLLDAAAETLNRDGIQGATTREIARRASVNEVTLFRHFKSKEQLLRAVLQRGLAAQAAMLDEDSSWKENLRESMENYVRHYYSHLEENKDFTGAFLAEVHLPRN
jgi:AcrR family transcriptional regulator